MSGALDRLGIEPGLLKNLAGIVERRVYHEGIRPSEIAAATGERALERSGVDRGDIGALINTSVCRDFLEPSTASLAHGLMGLSSEAVNFDVGNACLGFLNGMSLVAGMIERGEIDHGLVVNAETSRFTSEATMARLAVNECDDVMFREQFVTFTLGSGATVLSRAGASEGGHRFLGGLSRVSPAQLRHPRSRHRQVPADLPALRQHRPGGASRLCCPSRSRTALSPAGIGSCLWVSGAASTPLPPRSRGDGRSGGRGA